MGQFRSFPDVSLWPRVPATQSIFHILCRVRKSFQGGVGGSALGHLTRRKDPEALHCPSVRGLRAVFCALIHSSSAALSSRHTIGNPPNHTPCEHSSGSPTGEKSLFCGSGDGFGDEGAAGVVCIFLRLILCQLLHLLIFSPILKAVFSPCL